MSDYLGTSRDRRPDTVSFDYLTAFSFGPVSMQDPSEGVLARAWRVRYAGLSVFVSRSLADAWEAETVLFQITDGLAEPLEVDLAFTFSGDPVVVLERPTGPAGASEIWIYYYDPTVPGFVLQNFGSGRNPRAVIDQPHNSLDADVQVFYVSDLIGLVHRQQRDRYINEYFIAPAGEDVFVQEALIRVDRRIELVLAVRNQVTGRFDLQSVISELYPILAETESIGVWHEFAPGSYLRVVLFEEIMDAEGVEVSHEFAPGTILRDLLILVDAEDAVVVSHSFGSGELLTVVLVEAFYDIEGVTVSHSFGTTLLDTMVIPESFYDLEGVTVSHSFGSAELVNA